MLLLHQFCKGVVRDPRLPSGRFIAYLHRHPCMLPNRISLYVSLRHEAVIRKPFYVSDGPFSGYNKGPGVDEAYILVI